MTVRDHMDTDLVPVEAGDSCERALAIMRAASLDVLPVLDRERLVGLVSELDIRRRAPQQVQSGGDPDALLPHARVSGVMTYASAGVVPSTSLTDAAALMLEHGLSSLPVLEGDRLVGIVTMPAILGALVRLVGSAPSQRNGSRQLRSGR